MDFFFRLSLRFVAGGLLAGAALLALLFSFVGFGLCLLAGVFVGAWLGRGTAARRYTWLEAGAYASGFVGFAFVLGPGSSLPVPFFLFYLLCSGLWFVSYRLGGALPPQVLPPVPAAMAWAVCLFLCTGLVWEGLPGDGLEATLPPRLFTGPVFLTNNPDQPEAEAVLVRPDGTIARVYDAPPTDTIGVELVELPGQLAVPGLHAPHVRLQEMVADRTSIDLAGTTSRADLRERVAAFIEAHPGRTHYTGHGWDPAAFTDAVPPTWEDLEGLTEKPILLHSRNGHTALANRPLLETTDWHNGTLTDALADYRHNPVGRASGLVTDTDLRQAAATLPPLATEERQAMLRGVLQEAAHLGLTSLHDRDLDPEMMDLLLMMQRKEPLPVRVFTYLDEAALPWLLAHRLRRPWSSADAARRDGRTEVMGLHVQLSAANASPGSQEEERQIQRLQLAQTLGYQISVEAFGDAPDEAVLDWLNAHHRFMKVPPELGTARPPADPDRPAVNLAPEQVPVALASWQSDLADPEEAYLWHALVDAGALVAFGPERSAPGLASVQHLAADTAAAPPDPVATVPPPSFQETLHAYTQQAAEAVRRAESLGSLEVGKQFDVSIFDRDCRSDRACWAEATPRATVVGGSVPTLEQQ